MDESCWSLAMLRFIGRSDSTAAGLLERSRTRNVISYISRCFIVLISSWNGSAWIASAGTSYRRCKTSWDGRYWRTSPLVEEPGEIPPLHGHWGPTRGVLHLLITNLTRRSNEIEVNCAWNFKSCPGLGFHACDGCMGPWVSWLGFHSCVHEG